MTLATVRARAQGSQTSDSTTHPITLPTTVAGDLLLVAFASDTATATVSTSSTGWAILASIPQGATTNHTGSVLWKRATGSDALTVNTSTAEQSTHISISIQSGNTPEETDANGGSASSTTPTAISPSGGTGDYLCVLCSFTDSSTGTTQSFGTASGFSNVTTQNPTTTQSAATNTQERGYTAVSSFTPGAVSLGTAEQWVSITVAVPYLPPSGTTYTKTGTSAARGAPGGGKVVTKAPGAVFGISNYSLTIPVDIATPHPDADEIVQPALNSYQDPTYFYLDGSNRLVLTAPVNGATTSGSTGVRDEFREWDGVIGSQTRSAWDMATTSRQQTVSAYYDPTSIVGGSAPQKVMIIGQIHATGGTPPIYITVDYDASPSRVRLFVNGPSVGNLLTSISTTDLITTRIEITGGNVNIYGCVGPASNLPSTPQFSYTAASFTESTNCYLKAGAYNKTDTSTGSSGSAIATIVFLKLDQAYVPPILKTGTAAARGAPGGGKVITHVSTKTGAGVPRGAPGGAKAVGRANPKTGTAAPSGAAGGAKVLVSHSIGTIPVPIGLLIQPLDLQRRITLGAPPAVGVVINPVTVSHVVPLGTVAVGMVVGSAFGGGTAFSPAKVGLIIRPITVGIIGTRSAPSARGIPPIIVSSGVRVMAQTIIGNTWVHRELPIDGLKLTYRLSGPNAISGSIAPENAELGELLVALPPWGTWLHVEQGGDVRASGILMPPSTEEDGTMSITAVGPSAYAARIPYVTDYVGVQVDPIDVVRKLWEHIQSFPRGNLGLTVAGASGVLIGDPPVAPTSTPQLPDRPRAAAEISAKLKTNEFVNGDWSWPGMPDEVNTWHQSLMNDFLAQGGLGQGRALQEAFLDKYVAAESDKAIKDIFNADGPYFIRGFELPAIGQIIDRLGTDTPFDYIEECGYADPATKNVVWHRITCQSPQLGVRRPALNFTQGENIFEVGAFEEPDDQYADSAYVKGAGTGVDSIIGYSGTTIADRLRMPTVVTDQRIMTAKSATSRAAMEVALRLAAIEEIAQIAVNVRHPNAPWGTFACGDEILPRVRLPYYGAFAQWHRIITIEYDPDTGVAALTLTRRSGFGN